MTPVSIVEALRRRAAESPGALAFVVEGESMTFGDLLRDATDLAGRLARLGVSRGGRCAVLLPASVDAITCIYAAQLLGAAPVAIDTSLPLAAQVRRLLNTRPAAVFTSPALGAAVLGSDGLPPGLAVATPERLRTLSSAPVAAYDPGPGDTAYLQLTSGTTGEPRASVVSYGALAASLRAIEERYALTSGDVLAGWLPIHHAPGLVRYVFGTVNAGCPSHLVRVSALQFDRWLTLVTRVRATITSGPDFAYRLAAQTVRPDGIDLRSLRIATSGGEAARASTIELFERRFGLDRIVQPAYGQSEATMIIASMEPGDALVEDATGAACCGRALCGVEMRVVDEDGQSCASGSEGEIVVRGDTLFDGYFDDPAGTRDVVRGGWLHTGDIGVIDASSRLFPRSRARAMIKRAGRGIPPREIEEQVDRLDGVSGSAAVGVLRPGSTTEDLVVVVEVSPPRQRDWSRLAERVTQAVHAAIGAMPVRVLVVPPATIPRTANGKVKHAAVQRLAGDQGFVDGVLFAS